MTVYTAATIEDPAGLRDSSQTVPVVLLGLALAYPLLISPLISGGYTNVDAEANNEAAASNILNQVFWSALFLGALLTHARARISPVLIRLWPLCAYLVWSAVTIIWAVAPEIVFRRLLLQLFIIGAVVLPMVTIGSRERIQAVVLVVVFATLLLNLVALGLRPATPLGHPGIYFQKNELGLVAAIGVIVCVGSIRASSTPMRLAGWVGVAAGLVLLVASHSKTSLLLALATPLIGVAVVWLSRATALSPATLIGAGVAVILPLLLLAAEVTGLTGSELLETLFGDTTFTGRIDIWEFAWSQILERPFTGYGYNGFWGVGDESAALTSSNELIASILQAHNGYIDILLETGFVGLILFVTLLFAALGSVRALTRSAPALATIVVTLLVFGALHNGFESSALRRFQAVWLFLLVAMTLAAIPTSENERPSRMSIK